LGALCDRHPVWELSAGAEPVRTITRQWIFSF